MSKRNVEDYLQDILDAVAAIEQFTTETTAERLSVDIKRDLRQLISVGLEI